MYLYIFLFHVCCLLCRSYIDEYNLRVALAKLLCSNCSVMFAARRQKDLPITANFSLSSADRFASDVEDIAQTGMTTSHTRTKYERPFSLCSVTKDH